MIQNKFNLAMDCIDENIQEDMEIIMKRIDRVVAPYDHNSFGRYFTLVTDKTLGSYIRTRRLYYAAVALRRDFKKSIDDIARDYGYSEQSAFTRAFSAKYGFSPKELRRRNVIRVIPDDKYQREDFDDCTLESRSSWIWREIKRGGFLGSHNIKFLESVKEGYEKLGFDVDTCYSIADLSEKLEIPVCALMRACFDLVKEIKSDPDYYDDKIMVAIELGVRSDEDLQKICRHYECKYYQLNSFMVDEYYNSQS